MDLAVASSWSIQSSGPPPRSPIGGDGGAQGQNVVADGDVDIVGVHARQVGLMMTAVSVS